MRERRGARLKEQEAGLFTGEIWSGARAVEFGLADGLSDVRSKMRELFGEKVRLKLVSGESGWLRRRLPWGSFSRLAPQEAAGFAPASLADDVISALEARALWARLGF